MQPVAVHLSQRPILVFSKVKKIPDLIGILFFMDSSCLMYDFLLFTPIVSFFVFSDILNRFRSHIYKFVFLKKFKFFVKRI